MAFDSTGRLLMSDDDSHLVLASTGGAPTALFSTGTVRLFDIEIGPSDLIYSGANDGKIRIHGADGSLLNDMFSAGFGGSPRLAFGKGFGFGNDLYVLDDGDLFRLDVAGTPTIVGSGFASVFTDIKFGPDGALYVSEFSNDRILRVSAVPEPSSAVLAFVCFVAFGLGAYKSKRAPMAAGR